MAVYDEYILHQVADIDAEAFSDCWSYESIIDTLSYDYNKLFVEFDEIGVAGYLIANMVGGESELLRVAVRRGKRRQGIAAGLLDIYFRDTQNECTRYLLEVREGNVAARSLYENCGYSIIAERKNYYHNPAENAIIYERGNKWSN